jgi:hypothetical protein
MFLALGSVLLLPTGIVRGEILIDLSDAPTQVIAGTPFSFLVRLADTSSTKFVGYSLDVDVDPLSSATGEMLGLAGDNAGLDPNQSNFHLIDNVFEADSAGSLSSIFSVINDGLDGGVFVRGFESSFTAAGPPAAGHDVLAQVVFTTSPDASGVFEIKLGSGTELVNDLLESSPFSWSPAQIEVLPLPEPTMAVLASIAALAVLRRRRRAE